MWLATGMSRPASLSISALLVRLSSLASSYTRILDMDSPITPWDQGAAHGLAATA